MKRIVLIISVLFTGLLLSACDLVPEEYQDQLKDQLDEQLCRDNPDHELCNIENVSEVETTLIKGLVEDTIEKLQDGNEDTCMDVFAISNPDLIDSCIAGSTDLLPLDATNIEVLEVIEVDNMYKVSLQADPNLTFTVELTVGEIETALRITSWTLLDVVIDDSTNQESELTVDDVKNVFTEFVTNFLNPEVSDETIAMMYFNGMIDEELRDDRLNIIEDGDQIQVLEVGLIKENTYEISIQIGNTETEIITVSIIENGDYYSIVFLDTDDDCDGIDTVCEDYLNKEETYEFFVLYFLDYLNPEITNESFSDMYHGGLYNDEFDMLRTKNLEENVTIMLLSVSFREDMFFDIEYEVQTSSGDKYITKRPGRIRRNPDMLITEWDDLINEQFETDIVVVEELFNMFITDYLNPDKTEDDLKAMYFNTVEPPEFLMYRQEDLSRINNIKLLSITPYNEFGVFVIVLEFEEGTEKVTDEIRIKVKRIDMSSPALIIYDGVDDDCDGGVDDDCSVNYVIDDPTMFIETFRMYMNDFINLEVTNDQLSELYFQKMYPEELFAHREMQLAPDLFVEIVSYDRTLDDGFFTVTYIIVTDMSDIEHTATIRISMIDTVYLIEYK